MAYLGLKAKSFIREALLKNPTARMEDLFVKATDQGITASVSAVFGNAFDEIFHKLRTEGAFDSFNAQGEPEDPDPKSNGTGPPPVEDPDPEDEEDGAPDMPGPDLPSSCVVCGCTEEDCRECIEETGTPCSWAYMIESTGQLICTRCVSRMMPLSPGEPPLPHQAGGEQPTQISVAGPGGSFEALYYEDRVELRATVPLEVGEDIVKRLLLRMHPTNKGVWAGGS